MEVRANVCDLFTKLNWQSYMYLKYVSLHLLVSDASYVESRDGFTNRMRNIMSGMPFKITSTLIRPSVFSSLTY